MVFEVALGITNRTLSGGLQRGPDAGEHVVERGEVADFNVANVLGDLLDHPEHGPLADRAVAALEGVVVRDALDRGLEQRKLVADKRVGPDEVGFVAVVAVGLGPVDEVEQRLEVGVLVRVDPAQCGLPASFFSSRRLRITSSTSALLSFRRVLKRAWILEKSLPCCLVRSPMTFSMSSCEVTNTHARPAHLVLSTRRWSAGPASAWCSADELANLVNEEVQPEVRVFLLVEPAPHLVGEILDRDRVRGLYCLMMPSAASPFTSAKARSMLAPSSALCSRP